MKTIETSTADSMVDGLAPRRLLDGGGEAFERVLVEPSLSERAPRASLERLARSLELPPEALPPLARAAHPHAPTRDASWLVRHAAGLRLGAVGVVAVGLGLTGWGLASRERESDSAPERAPLALPAPASTAAAHGRDVPGAIVLPVPGSPAIAAPEGEATPPAGDPHDASAPRARRSAPLRQREQPPVASASSVRRLGSSAEQLGLSAELRALEIVQRALQQRETTAATRALASYRRQFEHGELALEAELLGVEVALASGDVERARTRAREIASRPAAARYRQRLDALLRAAEVSDPARSAGAKANAVDIESAEVNR
jgi:hypothetical protein